jgi:hypothetical protein
LAATNKKVPILNYEEKSVTALKAFREYLKQAEDFVGGREDLPDASLIVAARFPSSTIHAARHTGPDRFDLGWPFIAAVIEDLTAPDEERRERYIDPWYFVVMLLMELPGGRFAFNHSNKEKFYYLIYVGPRKREQEHFLRRSVTNASSRSDVRQKKKSADSHYDYRRITFVPTPKDDVWDVLGQPTRGRSQTREHAIRFAVELFGRQLNCRDNLPILDLNQKQYEQLLRGAFAVADRMHEKLVRQLPDRLGKAAADTIKS